MKRKSTGFLAGVLVASMVATPLSYANVYAEDQDATGYCATGNGRYVSSEYRLCTGRKYSL